MPQFTPQQRLCLAQSHNKHKGTRNCYTKVVQDFAAKFPGVAAPTAKNVRKMALKLANHQTLHNLNSKASPGQSHSGRPK